MPQNDFDLERVQPMLLRIKILRHAAMAAHAVTECNAFQLPSSS